MHIIGCESTAAVLREPQGAPEAIVPSADSANCWNASATSVFAAFSPYTQCTATAADPCASACPAGIGTTAALVLP